MERPKDWLTLPLSRCVKTKTAASNQQRRSFLLDSPPRSPLSAFPPPCLSPNILPSSLLIPLRLPRNVIPLLLFRFVHCWSTIFFLSLSIFLFDSLSPSLSSLYLVSPTSLLSICPIPSLFPYLLSLFSYFFFAFFADISFLIVSFCFPPSLSYISHTPLVPPF